MINEHDPLKRFYDRYYYELAHQQLSSELLEDFCEALWVFYYCNKREFVWRQTVDPYHIVVSEIMLQQTQTQRVSEKFERFISVFPSFESLANASVRDVLAQWVGLGYNRRAGALQGIAQKIVHEYQGIMPSDPAVLHTFKGLGPATSSSIVAFAYNKPTVFIETNIRAVYLHIFFHDEQNVADKELMPLVALTVDQQNAREWYYALMDYGVVLKKLYKNPSRKSKHHAMQSKFEGSDRQIRGALVRFLTVHEQATFEQLLNLFPGQNTQAEKVLVGLCKEGFVMQESGEYRLG